MFQKKISCGFIFLLFCSAISNIAILYSDDILSTSMIPKPSINGDTYLILQSNTDLDAYSQSGSGVENDPFIFGQSLLLNESIVTDNIRSIIHIDNTNAHTIFHVQINFTQTIYEDGFNFIAIFVKSSSNIIFDNIIIHNNETTMADIVLFYFLDCTNITVQNTEIVDSFRVNADNSNKNPETGIHCLNTTSITIYENSFNYILQPLFIQNSSDICIQNNQLNYTLQTSVYKSNSMIYVNDSSNAIIKENIYPEGYEPNRIMTGIFTENSQNVSIQESMKDYGIYGIWGQNINGSTITTSYFQNISVCLKNAHSNFIENSSFQDTRFLLEANGICLNIINSTNNIVRYNMFTNGKTLLNLEKGSENTVSSNLFTSGSYSGLSLNNSHFNHINNNRFGSETEILKNVYNVYLNASGLNTFYENIFESPFNKPVFIQNGLANQWSKLSFGIINVGNWWYDACSRYDCVHNIRDNYTYSIEYNVDPTIENEDNIDTYVLRNNADDYIFSFLNVPHSFNRPFTSSPSYSMYWSVRSNNDTVYKQMWYQVFLNDVLKHQGVYFDKFDLFMVSYMHNTNELGVYNYSCVVYNGYSMLEHSFTITIFNDLPIANCAYIPSTGNISMNISDTYHLQIDYSILLDGEWFIELRHINSDDIFTINYSYAPPDYGTYNFTIYVYDYESDPQIYTFLIVVEEELPPDYSWAWWVGGIILSGIVGLILYIRFTKCEGSVSKICELQQKWFKKDLQ